MLLWGFSWPVGKLLFWIPRVRRRFETRRWLHYAFFVLVDIRGSFYLEAQLWGKARVLVQSESAIRRQHNTQNSFGSQAETLSGPWREWDMICTLVWGLGTAAAKSKHNPQAPKRKSFISVLWMKKAASSRKNVCLEPLDPGTPTISSMPTTQHKKGDNYISSYKILN